MTQIQHTQSREIMTSAHHDYSGSLNSYALFKVNSHEAGEDLVQDTFMKTWTYLVKGGKIDAMKSFLYHVLNNLIVDSYRKRKTVSLDVLVESGYEPAVSDSENIFNAIDSERAVLLIQRLPAAYQKVIKMRYLQELSLKEMSLITGKTKNTLAVQVHRGLEKLRLLYNNGSKFISK